MRVFSINDYNSVNRGVNARQIFLELTVAALFKALVLIFSKRAFANNVF